MYLTQGAVTLLITLVVLAGCATEEVLVNSAINSAIDGTVTSLNLPVIDG